MTLRIVTDILKVTAKYNKHVIFIAHEGAPSTNDDGAVLFVTLSLGGQLPQQMGLKLNEIWYMQDTGKERKIALRPFRIYKPMKSRMIKLPESVEPFVWKYDVENPDPKYELATMFEQWKAKGDKIDFPK